MNSKDPRMRGFAELLTVEEAWGRFTEALKIPVLEPEEVSIAEGLRRVLAENIISNVNIPQFNKAAMDGYAVRSADTYAASPPNPVMLEIIGLVETGHGSASKVGVMQAVMVTTGAPIPEGADSVIMYEYAELVGKKNLEVYRSTTPGENISKTGEDVKVGEKILQEGTILRPYDIGMLAALGKGKVVVKRRPNVAVMSTGSELAEPSESLSKGKIFDSNRYFLISAVKDYGCNPVDFGIVPDNSEAIRKALIEAAAISDFITTTGGTSAGEKDLVPQIINSIDNSGVIIHGVSMKPGKPVGLASILGKPVILLPGYPVSAMIAFKVFAERILDTMLNAPLSQLLKKTVKAKLIRRIPSSAGTREFVRVTLKQIGDIYLAEPLRTGGASVISSMVRADGVVVIKEEKEGIEEGEVVDVYLLR